jgi:hypothetical protein
LRLEALDHPKTLDLAARLNVELPTAIGMLELLWAFTGKKAPQGNIGKFPDGAIARSCYWMGDPQVFIDALIDAGFVDEHQTHGLCIHDWADHCPRWVHAKLKKAGLELIATVVRTVVATTEAIPRARAFPREGKGREGKCIRTHAAVRTPDPTADQTAESSGPPPVQQTADGWSDEAQHAEWLAVAELYPPGAARVDWIAAEKAARQLIEDGQSTWDALRAGVTRYAAHCTATNRMVSNPAKFFTDQDKPWSQAWPIASGGGGKSKRMPTAHEIAAMYPEEA